MKFKYVISLVRSMRVPGFFAIMRDWQAFVRIHFIYAAFQSGLLRSLSSPCSRDDLIEQLGAQRVELLDALLEVGLSLKELACKGNVYRIRGKRSKAVGGREGDMLSAMLEANISYYASAYRNAADRMRGAPLGEDLQEMGTLVARISKIADPVIRRFVSDVVAKRAAAQVLDVGCGLGTLLKTIHDANPRARGVGIDVDEEVARQAKRNMERWNLGDTFKIVSTDIRDAVKKVGESFDLITMINVIYYFENDERLELLKMLSSMLSPEGILVLVTHLRSRGKDLGAAHLNMVNCSLKGLAALPDLELLESALKQAGFAEVTADRLIPGSMFYGICGSRLG